MLQWESETKQLQQKLKEKQALIDNLKAEKENLENRIEWCSNEIENQRKQINEQANALSKKSKRIETLEGVIVARDIMIKSQNEKNLDQEQTLKSFAKTISDLKSQLAEAEHQNDLFVSDLCYYEETEHKLRFEIDKKDYYHSLYQSEMKAHDLLKNAYQEQANVHQSQLNERAQEIETLKKDLTTASSELEQVKLKSRTIEDRTYYNALNADEYELSLIAKDSKIQEYLDEINAKDAEFEAAQILSPKPCCPVCLTDLDENKKMIAFYRCGHRACSECFDEFPVANKPGTTHDYKRCPICEAWIVRSMVLADT